MWLLVRAQRKMESRKLELQEATRDLRNMGRILAIIPQPTIQQGSFGKLARKDKVEIIV